MAKHQIKLTRGVVVGGKDLKAGETLTVQTREMRILIGGTNPAAELLGEKPPAKAGDEDDDDRAPVGNTRRTR